MSAGRRGGSEQRGSGAGEDATQVGVRPVTDGAGAERLRNLDESLGFAPVEDAESPPTAPPAPARGLTRRPAAAGATPGPRRSTDVGRSELAGSGPTAAEAEAAGDAAPKRSPGSADAARIRAAADAPLPRVVFESSLIRAGDLEDPASGAAPEPSPGAPQEGRGSRPRRGNAPSDRPPVDERRDVEGPLVRPVIRPPRSSPAASPSEADQALPRATVRARGLTRRPGRDDAAAAGAPVRLGPPVPPPRGVEPVRAGVRREGTGPRVGRAAASDPSVEPTQAARPVAGRGPARTPAPRVEVVSARLQREPTDPARVAAPSGAVAAPGRPLIAPTAQRQRDVTDPGVKTSLPPSRLQREVTDPGAKASPPPSRLRREVTDPGREAAGGSTSRVQHEKTDPGREAAGRRTSRVQHETTDPGREAASGSASHVQHEATDPGREAAGGSTSRVQSEQPGSSVLGVDSKGRDGVSRLRHEPSEPGAPAPAPAPPGGPRVERPGRPGPGGSVPIGAPRPGGGAPPERRVEGADGGRVGQGSAPVTQAQQSEVTVAAGAARAGVLAEGAAQATIGTPAQRSATVPAGAAWAGVLAELRQTEGTETAAPLQREVTAPAGAARAGQLAAAVARPTVAAPGQQEGTVPAGAARAGQLAETLARPTVAAPGQQEGTVPAGAARAGQLAEALARPTVAAPGQQEGTVPVGGARAGQLGGPLSRGLAPDATPRDAVGVSAALPSVPQRGVVAAGAAIRPTDTAEGAHRSTAPQGSALIATGPAGAPAPGAERPEAAASALGAPLLRRDRVRTLSPEHQAETNAALQRAAAAVRALVPTPAPHLREDEREDPLVAYRPVPRTVTSVVAPDERLRDVGRGPQRAHPALRPLAVFKALSIVAMLLLFEAIALPTPAGAPWQQLGDPGGVTFVGLAFLLLVVVAHILPVRPVVKAGVATGVGLLLAGFAMVVAETAVRADLFDGQPVIAAALGGPLGARILVWGAAMAIPFALFWRQASPDSVAARVVHGVGVALVLFAAVGLGALGLGAGAPVTTALEVARAAPLLGDRLVAAVGLLPLLAGLLSLLAFLPHPGGRRMVSLALVQWLTLALPLVVAALFVARSDAWMTVLEPLKVASFVAVGLLYLPAAAAAWLGALAASRSPSPEE